MGRWDQKRPAVGFDLDKAGVILIGAGVLIVMLAAGSNIIGSNLGFKQIHKDMYIVPGLVAQIIFIAVGVVSAIIGVLLLFINGGYIRLKPLEYGDDKFGKDWD
jgi:hypothetical protein